jgi:hypothetical protein
LLCAPGSVSVKSLAARQAIVLVISDQKLPVEKWESEFDVMLTHSKWSGVVFFLDKDGSLCDRI